MGYLSTSDFESQLVPGMKLKLRKMSSGRRADFNLKTADVMAELNQAREPLILMGKDMEAAKESGNTALADELDKSMTDIQLKIWNDIIASKLYRTLIAWGVESIDGWEIDGQPATVALILERAPDEIIVEIGKAIDSVLNMTFEEQMGFKSPSTSSAQADGKTTNTDAPTVEVKVISITAPVGAPSTIPA